MRCHAVQPPVRRSYVRKTIDLLSWDSLGQKHARQHTRVYWRLSVKSAREFAPATSKSCCLSPVRCSPVVRNTVRNGVTLHDYSLPAWDKYPGYMLIHMPIVILSGQTRSESLPYQKTQTPWANSSKRSKAGIYPTTSGRRFRFFAALNRWITEKLHYSIPANFLHDHE